jgi:hypothetical protein
MTKSSLYRIIPLPIFPLISVIRVFRVLSTRINNLSPT